MWTSQVYGHHDKMARTKTHRTSQTRSIQRRNIRKEITIFCVFGFFWVFLFLIFNYLKDFSKNVELPPWYGQRKNIGGLNQFSTAVNLTLSQHFLEKKVNETICI